jgi:DNA-binding MarR family transcriptional regulator
MSRLSLKQFGDRLVVLLPALMQEMWHYERAFFTRGEITFQQLFALTHLYQHNACSMRQLALAMHSRESTITGLVDRMTRLKLLKRVRSRTDRRVVTVIITAHGKKQFQELQRQRQRGFMEMFKRLGADERASWLEIIEKLVRGMSPNQATDRGTR